MVIDWGAGVQNRGRRYLLAAFAVTWTATLSPPPVPIAPFVYQQDSHWLLRIHGGPHAYRLADKGGTYLGVHYAGYIAGVQPGAVAVNLDNMSASFPSATVTLAGDIRDILDPMLDLRGVRATLMVYDGSTNTILQDIRARISELSPGFNGDLTTFSMVQEFYSDHDYPPNVLEIPERFTEANAGGSEGLVYQHIWGSPIGVPLPRIGKTSATGTSVDYLVSGHALAPVPSPQTGFPNDNFPDVGDLTVNTITGMRYGPDARALRDSWRKTTLATSWVTSGTIAPAAGGVTFGVAPTTGDHYMTWQGWAFHSRVSQRWRAVWTDAGAKMYFFLGWTDANNFTRVTFDVAGNKVSVQVFVAGASVTTIPDQVPSPVLATASAFYSIDYTKGQLEVGIGDQKLNFGSAGNASDGTSLAGVTDGYIGWGVNNGRIVMDRLTAPSAARATNNPNIDIVTTFDLKNQPLVVQKTSGDVSDGLFGDFYIAQGVGQAGHFLHALLQQWEGYSIVSTTPPLDTVTAIEEESTSGGLIDKNALRDAIDNLSKYSIGAYFADQASISSVLRERFAQQFLTPMTFEEGLLTFITIDPLAFPEQRLILGDENQLIERLGSPVRVQPYSHFKAKYRFNAQTGKWKTAKYGPDDSIALRTVVDREGRRDFPVIFLRDVYAGGTAHAILAARAALYHNAWDISYRRRIRHYRQRLGRTVTIKDTDLGFTDIPAVLIGKQLLDCDNISATYRVFHPITFAS